MGADDVRAAVDCGTNSTRLLVIDGKGERLRREMTITRLGAGVDEHGHLDDEALQRTLDTVERYRGMWKELGATRVRIAATSAVRDADNRERFFDGIRAVAEVDAEVLSGEDEANLTFAGVQSALDVPDPVTVFDVGGGSTEVVVGDDDGRPVSATSLQLGCVRLTERLLPSDPPGDAEIAAAKHEVGERLDEAARRLDADPSAATTLVGVAGTVTTLAALHLGLDTYETDRIHGTWVPGDAVRSLTDRLGALPAADRAELGPMSAGREDVIYAGALIVVGMLERFGFVGLYASEADILDGLAASA